MLFEDRFDAGQYLATQLCHYRGQPNLIILALPRGGVPVAYEVAKALRAPLDVFLVRKLGFPQQPELAMGAIAQGGMRILHDDVADRGRVPMHVVDRVAERELREIERQQQLYRPGRAPLDVGNRTVILVDDGLATGSTMRVAVEAIRAQRPRRLVVAVPVGSADTCAEFAQIVDEAVCAARPEDFRAVGMWYRDFSPTPDSLVQDLLKEAAHWRDGSSWVTRQNCLRE